jgi:hypothetical protein
MEEDYWPATNLWRTASIRFMRLPLLAAAMIFSFGAICQDNQSAEMKYLTVPPLKGPWTVRVSALNIEHGVEYPTVIRLKGNVEIKTPVCVTVGEKKELVCDGYMILHADEATFDEATGAIEAHGNVSVIPIQHEGKK